MENPSLKKLHLYSIFHLNMAFSSIEEEKRPEVIERCYWPLLRLVSEQKVPLGIEASGYSLEVIEKHDPAWVAELAKLNAEGLCEVIGSGYSQLIGPLVPGEVNRANQQAGLEAYEKILGVRPRIVLVSEQAWSAGMVQHYLESGYEAVVMEWDNPGSFNPHWDSQWRYLPQQAVGLQGETIPVIWNKSIPFQKFQRYSHGEMELERYLEYLGAHCSSDLRAFSLYGNDAEVFDFRPGRFQTESALELGEWSRIAELYRSLQQDPRFELVLPGSVLEFLSAPEAGKKLRLESSQHPVPVKKQAKYNITRWAVSGRDDLGINTDCWRIYKALKGRPELGSEYWKELCFLWSSDFRTHITEQRWAAYRKRLSECLLSLGLEKETKFAQVIPDTVQGVEAFSPEGAFQVERNGAYLEFETPCQKVRLNCRRGLAVEEFVPKAVVNNSLIGTLAHGFYDDIAFGADYYTGHMVLESPNRHKVTDLNPVTPLCENAGGNLKVWGELSSPFGSLTKELVLYADQPQIDISYHFNWKKCPNGSLRVGHITLDPRQFDSQSLFYRVHNGGFSSETFPLTAMSVNHHSPVSALVSASQGLGITSGLIEIGDSRRSIQVEVEQSQAALVGQIYFQPIGDSYLCRLVFSAMESDDTSCKVQERDSFISRSISLRISAF